MITEKELTATPSVCHLFLKSQHGKSMLPVQEATAISAEGLQNDASRGRSKRQVLLIELETLSRFGLKPGELRENIVVSGIALAGTATGTRLHAGPVELEVTFDCAPCDNVDNIRPGLQQEIEGCRGTLCRVIQGGTIKVGDTVTVSGPSP